LALKLKGTVYKLNLSPGASSGNWIQTLDLLDGEARVLPLCCHRWQNLNQKLILKKTNIEMYLSGYFDKEPCPSVRNPCFIMPSPLYECKIRVG